eukprot:gene11670-4906_t
MVSALIIIDVQNDFCQEGSIEVKGSLEMIKTINKIRASKQFDFVFHSQDFHPINHCSFAQNHEGKSPFEFQLLKTGKNQYLWPVHCVQNSKGAQFHPNLIVKDTDIIVQKGTNSNFDSYSAFKDDGNEKTKLDELLKERNVDKIFVCGLALDYCVRYTALDGVNFGYDTYVIIDASRAVDPIKCNKKLEDMKIKGIQLVESKQFLE